MSLDERRERPPPGDSFPVSPWPGARRLPMKETTPGTCSQTMTDSQDTEATAGAEHAACSPDLPWLSRYPEGVDWHAPIRTTPLPVTVAECFARFADRPCIEFLGKRYDYAAIGQLVDRTAKGLAELGVGRGTRVGLYLPNTPYYVVFYQAVLRLGATVVNYNPLYAKNEVLWQIKDSGTSIMVTLDVDLLWSKVAAAMAEGLLERVVLCHMSGVLPFPKNWLFPIVRRRQLARVRTSDRIVDFEHVVDNDGGSEIADIDELRDDAIFQYTGGTTGTPKGAVLRHAAIAANAHQVRLLLPTFEDGNESFLGVLPLCHVFAMTAVMNLAMTTGSRMVLLPRFELEQVLQTLAREKPTIFPAVPAIYGAINEAARIDRFDLSSLKFCISGGAPLPIEIKRRFEKLTGCSLVEGYGLSECAPVAACNPLGGLNKEGSIGLPVPGTYVSIRSTDEPDRELPHGERGEVCVRGPQLMAGYWNKPEASAETLRDGWLRTGDVGTMDEDGYTFIVDRMKDVIFRGGYNVYPRVIEEAIYQHEAVAECSVVGVAGPKGEYPKAFVRLQEGRTMTAEELLAFLADRLSKLELPKDIEFRTEHLPKTLIGKPSKKHLREEDAARQQRA